MNNFDKAQYMSEVISFAEMLVGHLQGLARLDTSLPFKAKVLEAAETLHNAAIAERRLRDDLEVEWHPVVQPEGDDWTFEIAEGLVGKEHPEIPADRD